MKPRLGFTCAENTEHQYTINANMNFTTKKWNNQTNLTTAFIFPQCKNLASESQCSEGVSQRPMPEDHQGGDQHRRASAQPHQAVDHLEKLVIACAMLLWGMPCKTGILDGCSMVVLKCSENQPEDPHSAVTAVQCLLPA